MVFECFQKLVSTFGIDMSFMKEKKEKEKKKPIAGKCQCTAAQIIQHTAGFLFFIYMPGTIDLRQDFLLQLLADPVSIHYLQLRFVCVCFCCSISV